jgi:hypothetical protein
MTNTRAGIEFRTATKKRHSYSTRESAPSLNENVCSDQFATNEVITCVALDLIPIGIVVLDAEMRAQFINRAFRRMGGFPTKKRNAARLSSLSCSVTRALPFGQSILTATLQNGWST